MRSSDAAKQLLRSVQWKSFLGLTLFFFLVAAFLQYRAGVFDAEFGSEPDEAAHYVTGLFVRDYLAGGFLTHPKVYATEYYKHYPKVALGHWPPGFYLLQSAWTLPFSPQRTSVVLMMAMFAALCSTLIYSSLREYGVVPAFTGGILFLLVPLVQQFYGAIMTEVPITLLALLATLYFARYLETEQKRYAVFFGLVAAAAIMTKFSGLLLAFVPGLAVLFARKVYLMKRLSFWLPAIIVAVICVPWMVATYKLASDGMAQDTWGMAFTGKAVPYYGRKLVGAAGIMLLLFCVIGFMSRVFIPQRPSGKWAAFGALLVGVFLLHVVVPCGYEARHLVPIFAPVILFAIAGAMVFAQKLTMRVPAHTAAAIPMALLVSGFAVEIFEVPQKGYSGFRLVALELTRKSDAPKTKLLISSDARGEGMFVSEVAMNEKRPGHIVQRASKVFASSGWGGSDYKTKVEDPGAVIELLAKEKVSYLVIDEAMPEMYVREHHRLLRRAVEERPEAFELTGTHAQQRKGEFFEQGIKVYRFRGN